MARWEVGPPKAPIAMINTSLKKMKYLILFTNDLKLENEKLVK
jgi:hypothetical protein